MVCPGKATLMTREMSVEAKALSQLCPCTATWQEWGPGTNGTRHKKESGDAWHGADGTTTVINTPPCALGITCLAMGTPFHLENSPMKTASHYDRYTEGTTEAR